MNLNASTASSSAPAPTPKSSSAPDATQLNGSNGQPSLAEPVEPSLAVKRKLRGGAEGSAAKRSRLAVSNDHTPPTTRLADLGGVSACVEQMLRLVALPLSHPEVYLHTGVQPPRGVLLHGPPGCGKTLLANAIAGVC